MGKQRKQYQAAFKSKVALEAIKAVRTVNEIATHYGVHPTQVAQWKKQALEHLDGRKRHERAEAELQSELYHSPAHLASITTRSSAALHRTVLLQTPSFQRKKAVALKSSRLGTLDASPASGPVMAWRTSIASSIVLVMGPSLSRDQQSVIAPVRGTRPNVGRRPVTPHRIAGLTILPPVSLPTSCGPKGHFIGCSILYVQLSEWALPFLGQKCVQGANKLRVANLERQPHHQSGSQLVIRKVTISSVSLRHSLHEERKGLPEALGPGRCPFVMTQTHHNQVM
jgi:transposase